VGRVCVRGGDALVIVNARVRACVRVVGRSDVYGIGLKTLIAEGLPTQQAIIANAAAPRLLTALSSGKKVRGGWRLRRAFAHSPAPPELRRPPPRPRPAALAQEVLSEALQVSAQLFGKSGTLLESSHKARGLGGGGGRRVDRLWSALLLPLRASIPPPSPHSAQAFTTAILALLGDGNTTVRKWAISAVSALAPALGDANLETLVTTLLGGLDRKKGVKSGVGSADPRTLIQTIGSVSRQVGYRLGRHLARIIPLFLEWLGDPTETSPERDEQRENCLQVRGGAVGLGGECRVACTLHAGVAVGWAHAGVRVLPAAVAQGGDALRGLHHRHHADVAAVRPKLRLPRRGGRRGGGCVLPCGWRVLRCIVQARVSSRAQTMTWRAWTARTGAATRVTTATR
jgi:hypothetical protein